MRASVLSLALMTGLTAPSFADKALNFERIATLPVFKTLAADTNPATKTVAEIMAANADGTLMMFTDSPGDALVFVDITNPAAPLPAGRLALGGEPTSVAARGDYAYVAVNTSESYTTPSGHVAVLNTKSREILANCDVHGQPDSVAISPDGTYLAVAVENERDEALNGGALPQFPAGHLSIFSLEGAAVPINCAATTNVALTGLADVAPNDPEPEYVAINAQNQIVVTLQENNHLVLVDAASAAIMTHFTVGSTSPGMVPTSKNYETEGLKRLPPQRREPDAVAWLDGDRFVTADEGDYMGGSRGFTIWHKDGHVLYESGDALEQIALKTGRYPKKRADKKGTEPEAVTVAAFKGETLFFVNSERADFLAAYKDTGADPVFLQMLPTHLKPEGILAIPERGLLIASSEEDDAKKGKRAALVIYKLK